MSKRNGTGITARLRAQGFDKSHAGRVACSQCQAATINGVPTHEHGCPNKVRECRECGSTCEPGERYCSPCCAAAYNGQACDCAACSEAYAEDAYEDVDDRRQAQAHGQGR